MSDPWNAPSPRADAQFQARVIAKTTEYLSVIQWRSNCVPNNLDEAVNYAKCGLDGGKDLTMSLRPTNDDFAAWIQWANLTTFLFNRDTNIGTLLSCLRKP